MPSSAPIVTPTLRTQLAALGRRLRDQRKRLSLNATVVAEAAGMSRVTLHRIEKGEPSVTIGAWLGAFAAVGLTLELADTSRPKKARALPKQIRLADHPQLQRLAWQLEGTTSVTPREALSLYERNWRHVDVAALTDAERALIAALTETLGGKRLLV